MKNVIPAFLTIFLLAPFIAESNAFAQINPDKERYMKVDQIEQGMKGYGKTVLKGTNIEKFEVEVIDLIQNAEPKLDRVLIHMKHPKLQEARVVQGMSGSPVYLYADQENKKNPKMIGAVAVGLGPFQKDAIVGVTPIHDMIEDLKRPREQSRRDPELDRGSWNKRKNRIPKEALSHVLISGVSDKFVDHFRERFERHGIQPLQGAGGSVEKNLDLRLKPGSAVGLQLVGGDMNITATGTVTERIDDHILAFGHPFQNAGTISLPMTTAYVHTTVSTQNMSFKLASPVKSVGSFNVDRQTGIYGAVGDSFSTVPINITVRNKVTDYSREFSYSITDFTNLTPLLLQAIVGQSVQSTAGSTSVFNSMTTEYNADLEFQEFGTVSFDNISASQSSFSVLPALFNKIQSIFMNPYTEEIGFQGADIELAVEHEERKAAVESAWISNQIVQPGEDMQINIRLRILHGGSQIKQITVPVPEDLPKGKYTLQISSLRKASKRKYQPDSLKQLIHVLQEYSRPVNELAVTLKTPEVSITSGGSGLNQIPPSMVGGMMGQEPSQVFVQQNKIIHTKKLPWVILGQNKLSFHVKE